MLQNYDNEENIRMVTEISSVGGNMSRWNAMENAAITYHQLAALAFLVAPEVQYDT